MRIRWIVSFLLVFVSSGWSQVSTTGEVRGTVMDPGGAFIPGAELKLVSESAGTSRSAMSSQDGGFVFVRVEPGAYRLTATAKGFQTAVTSGIVVETARTTDVVMHMTLGNVTETVEVSETGAALETSSICQQENDGGNAPSHAQHGESGAPAVMTQGRIRLVEQIVNHALLLPQGFHRGQYRGFSRRIEPRHNAGNRE